MYRLTHNPNDGVYHYLKIIGLKSRISKNNNSQWTRSLARLHEDKQYSKCGSIIYDNFLYKMENTWKWCSCLWLCSMRVVEQNTVEIGSDDSVLSSFLAQSVETAINQKDTWIGHKEKQRQSRDVMTSRRARVCTGVA